VSGGFEAQLASPFGPALRRCAMPARATVADAAEALGVSPLAIAWIGGEPVRRTAWRRVRPKVTLFFAEAPRNGTFRTIALIAAATALTAAAGPAGAALAGGLGFSGAFAAGVASAAITVVGNLALRALFPPPKPRTPDLTATKRLASLASLRNQVRIGGAVPIILGRVRAAPDIAGEPMTFFKGTDQWLSVPFCHGVGPLSIKFVRVGQNPLSSLDDVEAAHVEDFDDTSHPLYARDLVSRALAVALEKDVDNSQFTAENTAACQLQFEAPQGLYGVNPKSAALRNNPATLRIRYRLEGAGSWTTFDVPGGRDTINGLRAEPRRHAIYLPFPSAGRWEVEVRRLTDEGSDGKVTDWIKTLNWIQMISFQQGRPFAPETALAMSFVNIRATGQLAGTLDELTAVVSSRCKAWNGSSWVDDVETSNPADLFRFVLQHPANRQACADSAIDLAALQGWATYCEEKGWTYSRRIDGEETVRDILNEIAAAGRAVVSYRNGKHTVIWDEEETGPVHHFTPANSRGFRVEKVFPDPPHGLRVRFVDKTNDWTEQERVVYAPGYNASTATRIEEMEMPGVTRPVQVVRFARYWLAEMVLRPETATLTADWGSFDVAHGDRVLVSHDVLSVGLAWPRVKAVSGQVVTLDEAVEIGAGTHALVFRTGADAAPVTRTIATGAGTTDTITLSGSGTVPLVGGACSFGPASAITETMRVKAVRRRSDLSADLTLVNDAPGIYDGDLSEVPDWSPTITRPLDPRDYAPGGGAVVETVETVTGAAQSVAVLTWAPPPFGTPSRHQVRWRRAGGAFETLGSADGASPSFRAVGLPSGAIEFEIATEFAGRPGLSKPLRFTATLQGETRKPAAPAGARLKAVGAAATISIDPPAEPWQARIAVRHSTAGSPVWETASPLAEIAGHVAQVPVKAGTYLIKWLSPFGVYSASAATLVSGLGALAGINVVESQTEEPGWSGDKLAMSVVSGDLELDADELAGSYTFQSPDLGEVFDARVTIEISGGGYDRDDEVADWEAVELVAEVTGVSDAEWSLGVRIRTTEDDPSGSPTWSDWRGFEEGDYRLRACEIEISADVASAEVGLRLLDVATSLDMPDRIESAGGVSVGSGGLAVTYGRPFRAVRGVVLQVVGGAPGVYAEPSSESETGFTATVRNAAGSAISGTINWQATGYGAQA